MNWNKCLGCLTTSGGNTCCPKCVKPLAMICPRCVTEAGRLVVGRLN